MNLHQRIKQKSHVIRSLCISLELVGYTSFDKNDENWDTEEEAILLGFVDGDVSIVFEKNR